MELAFLLALTLQGPEIRRMAADRDPDVRIHALESLRSGGDPRELLAFLADEHPRVRARTVRALAASADLDRLARPGLSHAHPLVRQGMCAALERAGAKAAVPLLAERLRDPDPDVRARAAESLGNLGDPGAADRLAEAFRRHSDWATRAYALEALARLAPEKARPLLPPASGDPAPPVRMVAAESLPRAGGPESYPLLPGLLNDPDWRVRVSAIEACREARSREAIGWLADRLGREKGRLRWDLVVALHDLTGNDLGLEGGPWQRWWEANRETFQVRPPPGKGKAAAPDPGRTQASFFKIPILSDRVIFILDLSGSMRDPAPDPSLTKLDVAKRGMAETVRSLDGDTRFGILGLGSDEDGRYTLRDKKTWRGRLTLLPATPAAKADAENFLRGLEAKGWTNLYDAIEYAFGNPEVDTIFLYSDGGASRGIFSATGEILENVRRMNRFRKIVIHTVEVAGEKNPADNRRLLVRLAEDSGGICRLAERGPVPSARR